MLNYLALLSLRPSSPTGANSFLFFHYFVNSMPDNKRRGPSTGGGSGFRALRRQHFGKAEGIIGVPRLSSADIPLCKKTFYYLFRGCTGLPYVMPNI